MATFAPVAVTERQYIVRISALLDRSTATAAGDLVQTYERAGRAAGRRLSEEERGARRVAQTRERADRDEQRRANRAAHEQTRRQERAAAQEVRQQDRVARERERREEQSRAHVAKIKDRYFAEEQRKEEQATRATERRRRDAIKAMASDAFSTAAAVGKAATRLAGQVAGGMGFSMDIGGAAGRNVLLEKRAIDIANQSTQGTAADRDALVKKLQESARATALKYRLDPNALLEGLGKFQATTGKLDVGMALNEKVARLGKAYTGGDVEGLLASAGEIASNLEGSLNAEERAQRTYDVLRGIVAQGAEGSIEASQMAPQLAKMAAQAPAFQGDVAQNILKMTALGQVARGMGGASSAAEAATAVTGFVNTLRTPARRKQFKGMDIDIEGAGGRFLDPFEIIKKSLEKTKGDPEAMKKLFANVLGAKGVEGLASTYRTAGGGQAGLEAVDKLLARFSGQVSEGDIDERLKRSMGTKASVGQDWQNRFDALVSSMMDKLIPSLEKLAPEVEKVVKAFADVVAWAAENPGKAITAAILASIGKAAIGAAISSALKKLLEGGGGGGGPGGGGPGGRMGPLGGAAVITAVAMAGYAGYKDLKAGFNQAHEAQTASVGMDMQAMDVLTTFKQYQKGKMGLQEYLAMNPGNTKADWEAARAVDPAALMKRLEEVGVGEQQRLVNVQKDVGYLDAINPFSDATFAQAGAAQQDKGRVEEIKADLAAVKAAMDAMKAQMASGIKVNGTVSVDNMPTGGPTPGRQGIPDPAH